MAILKILQYPDKRLHLKGRPVTTLSPRIKQIVQDMVHTLIATADCAALAATQLEIEHPPNITVINPELNNGKLLCLINPEISAPIGTTIGTEGCMSIFPQKISAPVQRAHKITVTALDIQGHNIEFTTEGFLARCIQHEYDHLQGVLYIDHLEKKERALIDKKIKTLLKKQ